MEYKTKLFIAIVGGLLASTSTQASTNYQFTILNVPDSSHTFVTSINNGGQAVGYFMGNNYIEHGFVYSNGSFSTVIPSYESKATDINDSGQIIGNYRDSNGSHGFVGDGVYTEFNSTAITPATTMSIHSLKANSLNNNGQVVGSYYSENIYDVNLPYIQIGFTNTEGNNPKKIIAPSDNPSIRYALETNPSAINDKGIIAGSYSDSNWIQHGFILSGESFETFSSPGRFMNVTGINENGQIVGSYDDAFHQFLGSRGMPYDGITKNHGFIYSNGIFTTLNAPDALQTFASAINANGEIAGNYSDSNGSHGFVYKNGIYDTFDVTGGFNTTITSMNNKGQVAGYFQDSLGYQHGFIATPVPEPEEWAMMLLGLSLMSFYRYKNFNQQI